MKDDLKEVSESVKARRAYYRKYYAENKEKIKAAKERYWERKVRETKEDEQGND